MGLARASVRALLLALISALALVAGLLGAVPRLLGPAGDRLSLRMVLLFQRLWCRGALAILGVRVTARGAPPSDACVLVSNHLSYLDIALLGAAMRVRFVSKAEVARWPGIGWLAQLARVVFVRREERRDLLRVGDELRRTLAAGISVAFFPEGTSTCGLGVRTFHAGLLQPAAEAGLPCLPVAIRYETPADAPAPSECVCWWGDMTFPPHLWRLMTLRGVQAGIHWGDAPRRGDDRKRLAAGLHADVSARFVPVRQASPAPAAELVAPR